MPNLILLTFSIDDISIEQIIYLIDRSSFSKSIQTNNQEFNFEKRPKIYQCKMGIEFTASRDIKEEIIQEFKDMVMGIDFTTPEDINCKISDITKKLRKLYMHGRDE